MPKSDQFFVTIKLFGPGGKYEQVFIRVTSWEKETIKGLLASDVTIITNHGSEEGNYVGKFLDTYHP
jgi:hypothetical protein